MGRAFSQYDTRGYDGTLRHGLCAHALAAFLLVLAGSVPQTCPPSRPPAHEVYVWFREEIERRFTTLHKASEYADRRLFHSTRMKGDTFTAGWDTVDGDAGQAGRAGIRRRARPDLSWSGSGTTPTTPESGWLCSSR